MNEDKQLQDEGTDWLYNLMVGVLLGALVIGSVAGHAWVSAGLP